MSKKKKIKARSDFKKWNKEKWEITDEDGVVLDLKNDEYFVPMYDFGAKLKKGYKPTKKIREKISITRYKSLEKTEKDLADKYEIYYEEDATVWVSNYGNVISFRGYKRNISYPLVWKKTLDKSGYYLVGKHYKLHRLVWFSFAYNAIKTKKKMPQYIVLKGKIEGLSDLKKIIRKNDYKIHHQDIDKLNNKIGNLELAGDSFHVLMHNLERAKTEEEAWKIFCDYEENSNDKDESLSLIIGMKNKGVIGRHINQEAIFKKHPALENEIVWRMFIASAVNIVEHDKKWKNYFKANPNRRIFIMIDNAYKCYDIEVSDGKSFRVREKEGIRNFNYMDYDLFYLGDENSFAVVLNDVKENKNE